MKEHLKGFHMTYWTPYNIGYWPLDGRNGVLVRFALMPPCENNNAQKWWDNFFEASYHGDAGDSEQVQWLYLKPRHSRARIWPINHAKRTSRGRTMALNVKRAYFEEIPSFQSSGRNGLSSISLRHHNIFQHLKMFACITHQALSFRSEQQEVEIQFWLS